MKRILLIFSLTVSISVLYGQKNLYTSDFEAYNAGTGVAKQAGAPWTTWSNAPGGTEDPKVSSTKAKSGTKSFYVINNNDLVFDFKDRKTGRYGVEWQMFVETGKLGYFNLLGDFNGNNSVWNFQAYVKAGKLIVDADGGSTATVDIAHNAWNKFKIIIDVDDDFATLYLDTLEVVSYKWSLGTSGAGTTRKLDAINFFGWNDNGAGSSGYFIDDFKYDSLPAPQSPVDLVANLDGKNIYVFWDTLNSKAVSFALMRNGKVVSKQKTTEYVDVGPWPGDYIYQVRAQEKGLGFSHSSNADTVTISGGVARDFVLMEEFTGTWCVYCPGAAMGLRDLIDVNKKEAVAIAYHNGDKYVNAVSTGRENYYSVDAFPTLVCDGNSDDSRRVNGGNATNSLYTTYLPLYEKRISSPGFHKIDLGVKYLGGDNYKATIKVEETFNAFSPVKLHAVLTESNIPEVWKNQTELDFVCRAMYPDHNGTSIDFTTSAVKTYTFDFSTAGYVKNNCEFIAFLQDDVTREVTQTVKFDISSLVGIEEVTGKEISIYPNPADDYFILHSDGNGICEVYNVEGKLIKSEKVTENSHLMDISTIQNGVYVVRYTANEKSFIKKLIKN